MSPVDTGPPMAQQVPETFTQSDSLELQNLNNGEGQARRALYDGDIDHNSYGDLMRQITQRRQPLQARQQQAQQAQQQQQQAQMMHASAMQMAMQHSDSVQRAKGFNDRVAVYTDPLTGNRTHIAEMKPGHFEQLDMGQLATDYTKPETDTVPNSGSPGDASASGQNVGTSYGDKRIKDEGYGEGPSGFSQQEPTQNQEYGDIYRRLGPQTETAPQRPQSDYVAQPVINQPYSDQGPGAILQNPGAMPQAQRASGADIANAGPNGLTQINVPRAAQQPSAPTVPGAEGLHPAKIMELTRTGRQMAVSQGFDPNTREGRAAAAANTHHLMTLEAQRLKGGVHSTEFQEKQTERQQKIQDTEKDKMSAKFDSLLKENKGHIDTEYKNWQHAEADAHKAKTAAAGKTGDAKKEAEDDAYEQGKRELFLRKDYHATPESRENEAIKRTISTLQKVHGWKDEHFGKIGMKLSSPEGGQQTRETTAEASNAPATSHTQDERQAALERLQKLHAGADAVSKASAFRKTEPPPQSPPRTAPEWYRRPATTWFGGK